MTTKSCPKCKAEVAQDERHCPNCPYSFPDESEVAGEIHTGASWSPIPMIFMLVLASLVTASWLMVFRRGAPGSPEADSAPAQPPLRKDLEAKQLRELEQGEDAPAPSDAPPSPQGKAAYTLPKDEEPPEATYVSYEAAKEPAGPKVTEWRFRGKVYDLVTLKPLAGAKVRFSDPGGEVRGVSVTDPTGAYKTVLPVHAEGGYKISVEAKGYARSYLNPEVENVPGLPEARRKELAGELSNTVLPPTEMTPYGAQPLVTDLYLAPSR